MDITKQINNILDEFDTKTSNFSEHDVSNALRKLANELKQQNIEQLPFELASEIATFDFCEDYPDQDTGWGTYFGPMSVMPGEDGKAREYPSIHKIDKDTIQYWNQRLSQCKNPILCSRYAGLIWDFNKHVVGEKANFKIGQLYIDYLIEIADKKSHDHFSEIRTKLKRAIEVSMLLNDSNRLEKARQSTLDYYESVMNYKDQGIWSMAYELLLENNKVNATAEQEIQIISILEDVLNHIQEQDKGLEVFDPWRYESVSIPLSKYYHKKSDEENLNRIVKTWGESFVNASENVDAMLASSWLQQAINIYTNFGFKEDKNLVLVKLREIGSKVNDNLKTISTEYQIPVDEINEYISIFTEKDLDYAFKKLVIEFLPKKEEMQKQVKEQSKKTAVNFLFTRQLQDYKGRVVATVGSITENLEPHVILQLSQYMEFTQFFLTKAIEAIANKFALNPSELVDYLYQSPVFGEEKKRIITKAVEAYFNEDFIVTTHLLIPQIEDAIRNLFELSKISILKSNGIGGFDLLTLGRFIREPVFQEMFGDMGENIAFYLQVLLTDNRGWNLRNNVCHGLMPSESFDQSRAERCLHVLICLSMIRK